MKVKVKYHIDIDKIQGIDVGDMIDLRCAEDTYMKAGEYKQIPLGVSMKLPDKHFAIVVPRSSTFKKYGILMANSVGVIDHKYCGTNDIWAFVAYATRDTFIPKNERICQFTVIKRREYLEFEEVDELEDPDRGGFGSTGRV